MTECKCTECKCEKSKIHELKSWVGLFEPIWDGSKTHDIRVMDRDYKVGDKCILHEYYPLEKRYTGRMALVEITYITSAKHQACAISPVALHPDCACLSIKLIEKFGKEKFV